MTRLYAIVLRLESTRPGAIPADHGSRVRGALYHLLEVSGADDMRGMHDRNQRKAFTCALISGGKPSKDGALHFAAGDWVELRITLQGDDLFLAFAASLRQQNIRLGAVEFMVRDVYCDPRYHGDSGHILVSDLGQWDAPSLIMHFITPTFFHLRDIGKRRIFHTLPDPSKVFGGLVRRYAELTGEDVTERGYRLADRNIAADVRHLDITQIDVEGWPHSAFIGTVRYEIIRDEDAALFHALAEFAVYAGVGYHTTAGLGQVRVSHGKPDHHRDAGDARGGRFHSTAGRHPAGRRPG